MTERPAWFDGCIIGGVFTLILLPASASMGFLMFLANLIAFGVFAARIIAAVKDGELG